MEGFKLVAIMILMQLFSIIAFYVIQNAGSFAGKVDYQTDHITVTTPYPDVYKCPYETNSARCIKIDSFLVETDNKFDCFEKTIKISYSLMLEEFACSNGKAKNTQKKAQSSNGSPLPENEDSPKPAELYTTNKTFVGYLTQNSLVLNEALIDNSTCEFYQM